MASKEPSKSKDQKEEKLISCDEMIRTSRSMDDSEKIKYFAGMYDKLFKLHKNFNFCYNTTKRDANTYKAERDKEALIHERLENLCRELQRQNRIIKDESLLKIREEEERREQTSQEFKKTLTKVTAMMDESHEQNVKLGDENRQMAERLASIYDEFKARETEVKSISTQIGKERQLADARCEKLNTEYLIEKQLMTTEREELKQKISILSTELLDSTKKASLLEHRIIELTEKLDSYSGKYEEFETTISRSGKVFDYCKSEITRMNKQISILESEITQWQNRYQKNMNTIEILQSNNVDKDKQIECLTKKQTQLEKLCRQLNAERKVYIATLKELGKNPDDIHVDPIPDEPEIYEPVSKSVSFEKTKSGAQKKQSNGQEPKKKQRNKKGKEVTENKTPMTSKEIQLAELKGVLQKVQNQVAEIQANSSMLPPATTHKQKKSIDKKTELERKENLKRIIENQCDIEAKECHKVDGAGEILVEQDTKKTEKDPKENIQVEASSATELVTNINEAQEILVEKDDKTTEKDPKENIQVEMAAAELITNINEAQEILVDKDVKKPENDPTENIELETAPATETNISEAQKQVNDIVENEEIIGPDTYEQVYPGFIARCERPTIRSEMLNNLATSEDYINYLKTDI